MSAAPLLRQPLATALAATFLTLGITGAAWATVAAAPPDRSPHTSQGAVHHR